MKSAFWPALLGFAALAAALGLAEAKAGADDKGTVVEIDGLKSRAPAEWQEEKPTTKFRLKQFRLPKVGEDKEDAVLLVIHLEGQGGSAEENVTRWKGMFIPPPGKSIDEASEVKKLKVSGVPVTYVDVRGTYKGAPFEKLPPKSDFRMLAVYWDSKGGPYFFRLVGPARTVEHYKKGFDEWLMGFK
ncbi:MAG TPA: hypothetical protein VNK04_07290 [Gemmataceae bacterium]|nr:hypothetical protein [Gemmataceae bacterium]